MINDLQPALSTPADVAFSLRHSHLLAELPAPTQIILSQTFFHRRLREVSIENSFLARCSDGGSNRPEQTATDWEMMSSDAAF